MARLQADPLHQDRLQVGHLDWAKPERGRSSLGLATGWPTPQAQAEGRNTPQDQAKDKPTPLGQVGQTD
jgi:hypothetical protein